MGSDLVYVVLFPETISEDGYLEVFANKWDAQVCYLKTAFRYYIDCYEYNELFDKVQNAIRCNADVKTLGELVNECSKIWYEKHSHIYSGVYEMKIHFFSEVN